MADVPLPSSPALPVDADLPEALQAPTVPVKARFIAMLVLANSVLYLCYTGIGSLLLALQVLQLDPANKVKDLGLVSGLSVLLALVCNPVAGAFSDRTTSRLGRRRPWILVGSITSACALVIMMFAQSVIMLALGWSLFQITSNFITATLGAIIPDQVPEKQRGQISGAVGIAVSLGSILGAIIIGQILKSPAPSYLFLIGVILIVLTGFGLLYREKVLPKSAVPPFHLGRFLAGFWLNPVKYPDFAWAWMTRFLPIFAYFLILNYMTYYLQDVIHYTRLFPGQSLVQGTSTVTLITTIISIASTLLGGFLSDRFQRRKIFIVLASIMMAGGMLLLALFPSWTMVLVASGVIGLGFGVYLAVDAALVTQVLPSAHDRGKDLGIINIASTLPQSLAPVFAALVLSLFHSYAVLFGIGAVVALLTAACLRSIKAVR